MGSWLYKRCNICAVFMHDVNGFFTSGGRGVSVTVYIFSWGGGGGARSRYFRQFLAATIFFVTFLFFVTFSGVEGSRYFRHFMVMSLKHGSEWTTFDILECS